MAQGGRRRGRASARGVRLAAAAVALAAAAAAAGGLGVGAGGCGARETFLHVTVSGNAGAPINAFAVTVDQGGVVRPLSFGPPAGQTEIVLPSSFAVQVNGADGSAIEVCVTAQGVGGGDLASGCQSRPVAIGGTTEYVIVLSPPVCGDGVIGGAEDCDGADLGGQTCESVSPTLTGGTLACDGACAFDLSGCTLSADCGNATLDAGEDCDGANLGAGDCILEGFDGGVLACSGICRYDTSGCRLCGNGAVESGEQCDGGDLGGATCASIGMGFASGTLGCTTSCTYDVAGCDVPVLCGNGMIDAAAGEQCDGTLLGGQTCATQGLGGGALACTPGCVFDTSGCAACGNGVVEMGESCDGSTGGTTCGTLGHDGGALSCAGDCTFDESGCTDCGNGNAEAGELCDGGDLGGASCASLGLGAGMLGCTTDCSAYDTSGCLPVICMPGAPYCDTDGRTQHVCNAAGTGPAPGSDFTCEFVCEVDSCRYVTNVLPPTVASCGAAAPALTPPGMTGTTVTIQTNAVGAPVINCSPSCDGATTTTITGTFVPQPAGFPTLAVFCLSSVNVPTFVTVTGATGTTFVPVLISNGAIVVDGAFSFDGQSPTSGPGAGGPGGHAGGHSTASGPAPSGTGPGAGGGGDVDTFIGTNATGGGGAGYGGGGGPGGDVMCCPVVMGGFPGGTYGVSGLLPVDGGSGGGCGATSSGGTGFRGGGGGGGVLHLVSRSSITVTGTLGASGGNGNNGGGCPRGGGGGGSGGAILLEAPAVSVTGSVLVEGGDGGPSAATCPGVGGVGASGGTMFGMPGAPSPDSSNGSGGGGGGGGRVRINAAGGTCPASVSPSAACTAGSLRTTP
ncbi:MAG TPA: hypothetical protein VG389_20430 [Myxococcota bacterium]|nr:hypothetical protein [Myxococcota bacterium]